MGFIADEWHSFLVLAEELHFHKASHRLFISQPALSKQIRKLEQEINAPLFVRDSRRVVLTEVGKALVPLARQLLQESKEASSLVREIVDGRVGTLRIGFGTSAMSRNLPKAVERFQRLYKSVSVKLSYMKRPAQIDNLLNEKLDIGFVRLPVTEPELDAVELFSERLVVGTPSLLSYKSNEGVISLRNRPWIILTTFGSAKFHVTEKFEDALSDARHSDTVLAVFRRAGFVPTIIHEASDILTVVDFIGAGFGVSLLPSLATRIKVPGVRFSELNMPEAEWPIGVVWKRGSEKANLIARFNSVIVAISKTN